MEITAGWVGSKGWRSETHGIIAQIAGIGVVLKGVAEDTGVWAEIPGSNAEVTGVWAEVPGVWAEIPRKSAEVPGVWVEIHGVRPESCEGIAETSEVMGGGSNSAGEQQE